MGLDIYLYEAEQARQNAEYEAASAALYEPGPDGKSPRDRMSDDEYKAWSAQHTYSTHSSAPSERYPDHLFDRRYLRSSYNGGGFNHAVPEMIGTAGDKAEYPNERGSLYWIFEPMEREWDSADDIILTADDVVKLKASKDRALEVAEELRKSDRLRVITISPNMFSEPPTIDDNEALRMYREHIAQSQSDGWYSTRGMDVFRGGISILAAIPGKATFNIPGVHLIYQAEDEGHASYIQSAEIVAEFCDEAIALIERDGSCEMSWSG